MLTHDHTSAALDGFNIAVLRHSPIFSVFVAVSLLVVFVGGIFAGVYYLAPGEGIALDSQFGDQHLKTAVALIELHSQSVAHARTSSA